MDEKRTELSIEEKARILKEFNREYNRKLRSLCKEIGVCDRCRRIDRPLFTGGKCEICTMKIRETMRKVYAKKKTRS